LFAELFKFRATEGSDSVGESRGRAILPGADDQDDDGESYQQGGERHDPRGAIEAGRRGGRENGGPVLLYEGLLDKAVAVSTSDRGHEFIAHGVGIGAADVVAFKQNLAATADAHQLMAELIEASAGIACARKGGNGDGENRALQCASNGRAEFGRHLNFSLQIAD
jgi:hypothetical protein